MGAQKAVGEDVNYTNKTLLWHCASPEREREWRGGGETFVITSERKGIRQREGRREEYMEMIADKDSACVNVRDQSSVHVPP